MAALNGGAELPQDHPWLSQSAVGRAISGQLRKLYEREGLPKLSKHGQPGKGRSKGGGGSKGGGKGGSGKGGGGGRGALSSACVRAACAMERQVLCVCRLLVVLIGRSVRWRTASCTPGGCCAICVALVASCRCSGTLAPALN